jgi:hypothetical protein
LLVSLAVTRGAGWLARVVALARAVWQRCLPAAGFSGKAMGWIFKKASQLPFAVLEMFPKHCRNDLGALLHDAIQEFSHFICVVWRIFIPTAFFLYELLFGFHSFPEFQGIGFLQAGMEFLARRFRECGGKIIDLFFEDRALRHGFSGLIVDPVGSHPRANCQRDKRGEHNAKNDFCGFGHAKVFL